MNKALSMQRSKLISSYGGVGSIIDTINNLSYIIDAFDNWPIYKEFTNRRNRRSLEYLTYKEDRLLARLKAIGFDSVQHLFQLEDFEGELVKEWEPQGNQKRRMVSSSYFPRMFYCPKCHKMMDIGRWQEKWNIDKKWNMRPPKCFSHSTNTRGFSPNLQQVRFVLASMETGEIRDIPWDKVYAKKGITDGQLPVWNFDTQDIPSKDVTFITKEGSSDLIYMYVKTTDGEVVTMAEIMMRYFVIDGKVYRPVVYNANNVYFNYSISSVYIPTHEITDGQIDIIKTCCVDGINVNRIKESYCKDLSVKEIQAIIDNNFIAPELNYTSEELFRLDEFISLTNEENYEEGVFCDEEERLVSEKYDWNGKPFYIKQLYLLKRVNVTSALVGYSRIDKISNNCISAWKGTNSENPKQWYDAKSNTLSRDIPVAIHPTCSNVHNVVNVPVVASNGEVFFIELNLEKVDKIDREVFMHTLSHLIMKELEFSCGYPVASMCERLYYLPESNTEEGAGDKYGIMIYSANGEAGSYGGISSLFETEDIKFLINQAWDKADDCSNDPICEDENNGSCFACVQIPETACEMFNTKLSRVTIKKYKNKGENVTNNNTEDCIIDDDDIILA